MPAWGLMKKRVQRWRQEGAASEPLEKSGTDAALVAKGGMVREQRGTQSRDCTEQSSKGQLRIVR